MVALHFPTIRILETVPAVRMLLHVSTRLSQSIAFVEKAIGILGIKMKNILLRPRRSSSRFFLEYP